MSYSAVRENIDFEINIVQTLMVRKIRTIDEVLEAIKEYRYKIAENIEKLENILDYDDNIEKQIAVLIRQDQYLYALQNKSRGELVEFLTNLDDNISHSEILRWYKPSNN